MLKKILIILAALMLCSCSEASDSKVHNESAQTEASGTPTSTETVIAVTTISESETSSMLDESSEAPKAQKKIKVDVIGYKGDRLTFEYNGEIQTYEVWDNVFSPMGGTKAASLIFNNRYGEKIPASIKLNPENTRVVSCDLLLERFTGFFNDPESLKLSKEDRVMKMEKTDETHIRIYNKIRSIEADICDLDNMYKGKYPESFTDVFTTGYYLPSGTYLADQIAFLSEIDEMGNMSYKYCDLLSYYCFFGTVQSVRDGRASVLLTDGKTTCDVPSYFNDGEVKEGAEVMVVLDADTSLFGSGEQYKSDYAVFYTDPVSLLPQGKKDITLFAYAKCSETQYGNFDCTEITELEASSVDKKQQ